MGEPSRRHDRELDGARSVLVAVVLIMLAFAPYYADILRLAQDGLTGLIDRLAALRARCPCSTSSRPSETAQRHGCSRA